MASYQLDMLISNWYDIISWSPYIIHTGSFVFTLQDDLKICLTLSDRLAGITYIYVQAAEQDRQVIVAPEIQMSKLLALILHIRLQGFAVAPLRIIAF